MDKPALYPFKFRPIFKNKIWGGIKLKSVLNKLINSKNCGESWEISSIEKNVSIVSEGELKGKSLVQLIEEYKEKLVGEKNYKKFKTNFPLLIKFIDANQDLSIQVHPNDKMAKKRHSSFGKTEMWYVVDAEKGASLISGFNKPTSKEEYVEYFNAKKLTKLLNKEQVNKDDVFFLPAGRVHTIGKGLLIAEIQQTSDITYRIYDFDRKDADGKMRKLHVEQAIDAIDYTFYEKYKTAYSKTAQEALLKSCQYFTTKRLIIEHETQRDYSTIDSFVVLMFLNGKGVIKFNKQLIKYALGDCILIPNELKYIFIKATKKTKLLEIFV